MAKARKTSSAKPGDSGTPDSADAVSPWLAPFSHANAVGFAIFDDRLRFQFINGALAAFNGVPVASHIGNPLREVLGDAADRVELGFRQVFRTGQTVSPFELSAKLPARREQGHWIETFFPVRSQSGKVGRVGALIVEVTRQRQLQDLLMRFRSSMHQSKALEAQLLLQELRSSVNGYHAAVATSLAHLSQRLKDEPKALASLVALLDKRLLKMQTLVEEVATRFPIGVQ